MVHLLSLGFVLCTLVASTMCEDFYRLPGQFIDISAKGEELWGMDRNRGVFRFDFNQGKWNNVPISVYGGSPSSIGASPDGHAWVGNLIGNAVYRYDPSTSAWTQILHGSTGHGACMFTVNAISKEVAVGSGSGQGSMTNGALYKSSGPAAATATWTVVGPAGKAVHHAAIGENGELWFIEKDTKYVYRQNGTNWTQMHGVAAARNPANAQTKGVAATLDVQNPNRVVMTTEAGRVYFYNGNEWRQLPVENAARATIGSNRVFILDEIENVIMVNM